MIRILTRFFLFAGLLPLTARAADPAERLAFVENRGQWAEPVRYAAQLSPAARVFARLDGLTYVLAAGLPRHAPRKGQEPPGAANQPLTVHAVRVEFEDAVAGAALAAEEPAPDTYHFIHGSESRHWAADARAWRQLRYRQPWPGTDVVLKENAAHQLEYDLLLAAGADATRPRLRYHGAESLRLDAATGNLVIQTAAGLLTEQRPQAWQLDARGRRQPVACAFQLQGATVSFRLGRYDHARPLVIDPVVQFASYTGSAVENWGFASTYDAQGNLYTAGVAFDPGFPTTTGAYQTTFAGNIDVAVMKFVAGSTGPAARAWATYLGGNGADFPHSLLVNARGELLLLGSTSSGTYPTTTGALGRSFRGGPAISPYGTSLSITLTSGTDLVLTRLSASGGRLRASTYLGGTGTDGLTNPLAAAPRLAHNHGDPFRGDLALDAQGNVYVASTTSSPDFPGLSSAYRGGLSDGLVLSLDSSLSRVRWATPLGGQGADAAYSLFREEATGDLLVAGGTTSANLAGVANGYLTTLAGGVDGFVARVTAGGALTQSTYLGTGSYDQAYFVRRGGPTNQVYVLGQTLSNNTWPVASTGRYGQSNGHLFIQQLAPTLRTAGFATLLGAGRPTTDISPTAFDVDCAGRLLLAGWGGGIDPNNGSTLGLPVSSNALQATTDGNDFYLMQLSDEARTLDYASFYGSAADDHVDGGSSRFNAQGTLFQALCACNQGAGTGIPIPAGANSYQATNGSVHCNNAAFKLAFVAGTGTAPADTLVVCARGGEVPLGGSPAGGTWSGAGVGGSVASGFFFLPDTTLVGTQQLTYTSPLTGLCAGTSTRYVRVLPQALARLTAPADTICLQPQGPPPALVPLHGFPAGGTYRGPAVTVTASGATFDPVAAGPGTHLLSYTVPGGRCPAVGVKRIVVLGRRFLDAGPPRKACLNDPATPLFGTPAGGIWTGPGVTGNNISGYYFTPNLAGLGTHTLLYSFPGNRRCPMPTDTLLVIVRPPGGVATVPPDTVLCTSSGSIRLWGGLPAGGTWSGPGVTGSVATGFTFTPTAGMTGMLALKYTAPDTSQRTCPAQKARMVQLGTGTTVTLSASRALVCAYSGRVALQATPTGGTWTGPGVTGSAAAGYFFTPSPALAGNQVLSYAGPASTVPGQCPGSGQLTIGVIVPPTVEFEPVPPVSFCVGVPPHGVVLAATPAGGTFSGPGVSGNRFNPALAGPGRHTLTYAVNFEALLGIDCPITVTQEVEVILLSPISLPADTVLCLDLKPFQLRAQPAGGTWSGAGVTPTGLFTPPAAPGTSVLTYTLPGGCGSQPYRVTVPAELTPTASWTAPACQTTDVAPRLIRFEATGPTAGQVSWDFGDGTAPATGAVVEHRYLTAGTFQPRVGLPGAGTGPCTTQLTLPPVAVQAAFLPNIITPNGDGDNDTFRPRVGGCPGYLQVFSRWGNQVYERRDYQGEWDGGRLPNGIYYYLLRAPDGGITAKGWVEIVR
ncbi:DUF7948 domain-containing protein [Hymenobacter jeollabukensis]|uniref:PKD domain-containing protein n=1 Tax=Hymenobacter jeollabukensis TaxID=2025313 RepID=A0A5R8WTF9_9BACT|nr:gliding motility-associated C-terminal domain-containing protein [Hymenobacter jeollabukensis]TLM95049.1 hypothetical protein FDY95_04410 [Hymenobacter jeollabukensis]